MARIDLTDFEWLAIQPLLPTKVRGVKWVDDRRVLNGILAAADGSAVGGHSSATVRIQPFTVGGEPVTGSGYWKRRQRLTKAICR